MINDYVPSGKYKDKKWEIVPSDYLEFIGKESDYRGQLSQLCRDELDRRVQTGIDKKRDIRLYPTAIDSASLTNPFIKMWFHDLRVNDTRDGLYTYLKKMARLAYEKSDYESVNDIRVYAYRGLQFKFRLSLTNPVLIQVKSE